ncbi:MAG: PAS domain-containing protein [Elusimicrobia bacterium]|nr:PAS domain-containing protein [Elusimicrobiota bacterium]
MADPPRPAASPAGPAARFERLSLEALQAVGKALGQLALYKPDHPAVAETLQKALDGLEAALALAPEQTLVVGLDQSKLLVNGRVAADAAQAPKAVVGLLGRFKLSSLTFCAGLARPELAALCELAASRADSPAAADPAGFLAARGVSRVLLNEAVYRRAKPGAGDGSGGGDAGSAARESIRDIDHAIQSGSLERTVLSLVEKSVPDAALRRMVIGQVLALLEKDVARHVDEVTRPLQREKKALENEGARTVGVIQSMAEGVVVVDEQGRILMMNPAAEQIYGEPLAKAAGRLITEKISDQFVVTLAAELQTPADRDIAPDVRVQGVADTRKTVRASGAVVQTEQGKVVGLMTALTDVAKHRELQRMQRDFVAHVTHELRAPLSSVRAALEILQTEFRSKLDEDWSRVLDTALRNSDRLAQVINGILDFSKIESGQMTVRLKPSDPAEIAREAADSLAAWAQKKGLPLELEPSAGLPFVQADASRAVQVLVNLLSNAIKFTPSAGRVGLALCRHEEGGAVFVRFTVSDTGPGVAPADQPRVFDKFVQASAGLAHQGGTGLGLSIAKALVELQNGRIWVESRPGKGAAFSFILPVSTAQVVEVAAVRSRPSTAGPSAPWWKRLLGLS